MTTLQKLSYTRGWEAGSYGNAYESTDWESWYADVCDELPNDLDGTPFDRDAWQAGLLLGFFASYEIDEIGDEVLADEVRALRTQYGEES